MLMTLAIPFVLMLLMKVSMNRIWSLYNMFQLLINLKNYELMQMPANLGMTLRKIETTVNFNVMEQPIVQLWLKQHVFGRMERLQEILVSNIFLTSTFATILLIFMVILIVKIQRLQMMF